MSVNQVAKEVPTPTCNTGADISADLQAISAPENNH
ncbi:unnamed protein product, partial [Dibothriocephalus latus]